MEVHFVCGSIKGMLGTIFTNSLFQNVRWQVLIQNVNLKEIKKKKNRWWKQFGYRVNPLDNTISFHDKWFEIQC